MSISRRQCRLYGKWQEPRRRLARELGLEKFDVPILEAFEGGGVGEVRANERWSVSAGSGCPGKGEVSTYHTGHMPTFCSPTPFTKRGV